MSITVSHIPLPNPWPKENEQNCFDLPVLVVFVTDGNVIACSQSYKIPYSCCPHLPALLKFDFTHLAPGLCLKLHSNPPQIHLSAVSPRQAEEEEKDKEEERAWPRMIRDIPHNNRWDLMLHQPSVCLLRETRKRTFNPSAISPRAVSAKDQHFQTSTDTNPKEILSYACFSFSFQIVLPSAWSPCGSMTTRSKLPPTCGQAWVLTGGGWTSRSVQIWIKVNSNTKYKEQILKTISLVWLYIIYITWSDCKEAGVRWYTTNKSISLIPISPSQSLKHDRKTAVITINTHDLHK